MSRPPLLQAKDLHISFYGVTAARGANLEIKEGEFLAIIGPNGSGKTTFLNLCTGYLKPHSGEVLLDGQPITAMSPRTIVNKGIARAFQIPQFFQNQTVLENLMISISARRGIWSGFTELATKQRQDEAHEILSLVGLDEQASTMASALPEGQRKLLDISLALALKPRLVLLDEPTSGVSTLESYQVMETLMDALRKAQVTALFVEHDMDIVRQFAERVAVWDAGSVLIEGSPEEVFNDPEVQKKVIGV